jgi:hypothetical protein
MVTWTSHTPTGTNSYKTMSEKLQMHIAISGKPKKFD